MLREKTQFACCQSGEDGDFGESLANRRSRFRHDSLLYPSTVTGECLLRSKDLSGFMADIRCVSFSEVSTRLARRDISHRSRLAADICFRLGDSRLAGRAPTEARAQEAGPAN